MVSEAINTKLDLDDFSLSSVRPPREPQDPGDEIWNQPNDRTSFPFLPVFCFQNAATPQETSQWWRQRILP